MDLKTKQDAFRTNNRTLVNANHCVAQVTQKSTTQIQALLAMQKQRPQRHRAILTEQQAIDIFRIRSESLKPMTVSSATAVAKLYGINERTVRDIWMQRTWSNATWSLAQNTTLESRKKMGRPIGAKDSRPRKHKFSVGTSISEISSDWTTPFTALKHCNVRPCFVAPRQIAECHTSSIISDQAQHDSVARRRLFSFQILDSSHEAFIDDRSPIEDQQEAEEESIDDQLFAWAQCGSHWIDDAAISLDGENPWDCPPSMC